MGLSYSSERLFKTVHTWLGVLILPWIIVIGLTGLYLNHWQLVNDLLTKPSYDEASFDDWPNPQQQDEADADALAQALWPESDWRGIEWSDYHGRTVWNVEVDRDLLIVDQATGHYWIKTAFKRKTYDPDGDLLHTKIYWSSLFKTVHEYGWFDRRFGTWLADITAGAMVVFGLTGLYLFTAPRMRRRKNRKKRLAYETQAKRTSNQDNVVV